jgi:CubicO group peptidase (beta-lactamase class C family)
MELCSMQCNKSRLLVMVLLVLITPITYSCGADPAPAGSSLDSASVVVIGQFAAELDREVAQDSVGSIVAAVVDGGSVVWSDAFGLADTEDSTAARVDGIYRTGSISKTFTAVLLLQLAERGVVGLDDKVVSHLPEFAEIRGPAEQVNAITLRQLANHTSGLIREPELEDAASGPIERWEDKVLASIPTTSLQTAPGQEYSYSNIGFGILGLALSRAAGRPFMGMVEEMIFQPLGMESSTFIITPALETRLSVGYANGDSGSVDRDLPAREHRGRGYKVPNGGVYSTLEDLGRFIGGLLGVSGVEILSTESRAEMQRSHTPEGGRAYGLGLRLSTTADSLTMMGHGGSVAGYNAHMLFEPQSELGVVLLRNYNSGETDLGDAAADVLEKLVNVRQSRGG